MPNSAARNPITDEIFEELYKQRRERLVAKITGMVRDRDRAEDAAADAFETVWSKRTQFRGDSSLATWLYAIGLNAARQGARERTDYRDPLELERSGHAEPDRLSIRLEQDELRARVSTTLNRVPAKFRRLLIDRYIERHSVQQIARRESLPIGTVGSRLFTARRMFREAWTAVPRPGGDVSEQKVRQIAQEALHRLTEELRAGRSDALKQYLAAMGRFHRYSWNNSLLIHGQRPSATRVAGYHTWNDLGRHVRRGEKGIVIVAPNLRKIQEQDSPARAEPSQISETFRVSGFRAAYVFDIEQTDGKPLPDFAQMRGDPQSFTDKLKAFVAEQGIRLSYDPSIAPADGRSSGGEIRLRPGLSPAEEFSVLTHELAHEMLHRGPDRLSLSKVVRETQAEAVAFVVSRGIGLETGTAARDYIALYNGDEKTLAESLTAIQQASSKILNALLPREAEQPERTSDHETSGTDDRERAPREDVTPTRSPSAPEQGEELSLER